MLAWFNSGMKYLRLYAILVLVGCGTEVKTLGKKPTEKEPKASCPPALLVPFHEMMVQFTSAPPPKLALVLEGVEEFNECKTLIEQPPVVTLERFNNNSVGILVQHFGAYPELPRDVSFRLLDLGDCKVAPVQLLAVDKAPLPFTVEYPYGPKCQVRTTARLRIQGP
jgi:hypothetical protein